MDGIVVANQKPVGGRLYQVFATISAIVVFVGFSRSYFLRPLFRHTPLELALHLHGAVMTRASSFRQPVVPPSSVFHSVVIFTCR